jgi:recombination protein RecA
LKNLLGYGAKTGTCGGKAVEYYSSIRIDMNRIGWIENDKTKVGSLVSIQTVKNKTAAPFQTAEIPFIFPVKRQDQIVAGLDVFNDIINVALDKEIIAQTGAWFSLPGLDKKLAGLQKVSDYYLNNPEQFEILKNEVINIQND